MELGLVGRTAIVCGDSLPRYGPGELLSPRTSELQPDLLLIHSAKAGKDLSTSNRLKKKRLI